MIIQIKALLGEVSLKTKQLDENILDIYTYFGVSCHLQKLYSTGINLNCLEGSVVPIGVLQIYDTASSCNDDKKKK